MSKLRPSTLVFTYLLVSIGLLSSGNKHSLANQVSKDPATQKVAEQYVHRITGLANLEKPERIYEDNYRKQHDNTPFLHKQIVNRRLCRITYKNVSLKLKSATPGFRDKYKRKFEVLFDPNSTRVLKITSKAEEVLTAPKPEPNAPTAEKQLLRIGEVYEDFAHEDPNVTFMQALDGLLAQRAANPLLAKEIDGIYVLHSHRGSKLRPVWIIALRGIPPLPHARRYDDDDRVKIPQWHKDRMRYVVDAATGKVIFATNYPVPEE